jgi:hypothetical protein
MRHRGRAGRGDRTRHAMRDQAVSPVGWATSAAFGPPGAVGCHVIALWPWAGQGPLLCPGLSIFENGFDIKNPKIGRNIENCRNARKIQSKLYMNPLEHLYTMDLTQSIFV